MLPAAPWIAGVPLPLTGADPVPTVPEAVPETVSTAPEAVPETGSTVPDVVPETVSTVPEAVFETESTVSVVVPVSMGSVAVVTTSVTGSVTVPTAEPTAPMGSSAANACTGDDPSDTTAATAHRTENRCARIDVFPIPCLPAGSTVPSSVAYPWPGIPNPRVVGRWSR
jgi:hypothetical protein